MRRDRLIESGREGSLRIRVSVLPRVDGRSHRNRPVRALAVLALDSDRRGACADARLRVVGDHVEATLDAKHSLGTRVGAGRCVHRARLRVWAREC